MTLLQRKTDLFYVVYLVLHVPITIVMDSTMVIPPRHQLAIQRTLLRIHIAENKDFLLLTLPLWLQVFGWFEMVVQLPVFVVGSVGLARNTAKIYPVLMVYGFNAFLTTLVCVVYALVEGPGHGLTTAEVWRLVAVYSPYLAIPFGMMVDMGWRVMRLIGEKKSQNEGETAKGRRRKEKKA